MKHNSIIRDVMQQHKANHITQDAINALEDHEWDKAIVMATRGLNYSGIISQRLALNMVIQIASFALAGHDVSSSLALIYDVQC